MSTPPFFFLLISCGQFSYFSDPKSYLYTAPTESAPPEGLTGEETFDCADEEVLNQTAEILTVNCYRCHGEGGQSQGGPSDILNVNQIISEGWAIEGDAASSRLFQDVQSGYMPLGGPPLSQADVATIQTWINCGASELNSDADRRFVPPIAELLAIQRDLEDRVNNGDEPFVRYISLVHLYNAGVKTDELVAYRISVAKLLASLTHELPEPLIPLTVPIPRFDEAHGVESELAQSGLLFRIDLREYGWLEADYEALRRGWKVNGSSTWQTDGWDLLLRDYPYGIYYNDLETSEGAIAAEIRNLTHSRLPVIKADWLAFSASQPPLYFDLLEITAGEPSQTDLDAFYALNGASVDRKVETEGDFAGREVGPALSGQGCAGFANSGVSAHNRVVCRVSTPFGLVSRSNSGYCWASYDFADDIGFSNIFAHPIDFHEGGGEIICSLRTGQQIYFIAGANGELLDRAPAQVVVDPDQDPDDNGDTVTTGLSCIRCHGGGIKEKQDEVAESVELNEEAFEDIFGSEFLGAVYNTYNPDLDYSYDKDSFAQAMVDLEWEVGEVEPISLLADRFRRKLTAEDVAANLGVDSFTLILNLQVEPEGQAIAAQAPQLLLEGGEIDRAVFDSIVRDLIDLLQLGSDYSEPESCGQSSLTCWGDQQCINDGTAWDGACMWIER
jgi:hypothetical protein